MSTEQPRHDPESEIPDPPQHEGLRAKKLREVFDFALSRSLNTVSYENFSACFPTSAQHAPQQLHNVWEQMCGFLEQNAKKEYETILKERDVVANLNSLDVLVKQAGARRSAAKPGEMPISPSMLPPAAILEAHYKPRLHEAQKNLNARITATQTNNSEVMEKIKQQQREMEELVAQLNKYSGYLEKTVVGVNTVVNGQRLAEETIDLERLLDDGMN
ncbi:hypothetical protein RUND412_000938 [Rhizina undulata]